MPQYPENMRQGWNRQPAGRMREQKNNCKSVTQWNSLQVYFLKADVRGLQVRARSRPDLFKEFPLGNDLKKAVAGENEQCEKRCECAKQRKFGVRDDHDKQGSGGDEYTDLAVLPGEKQACKRDQAQQDRQVVVPEGFACERGIGSNRVSA